MTDEGFAFTALFEEQGYLAADTNALDIAIATVLGLRRTCSGSVAVDRCRERARYRRQRRRGDRGGVTARPANAAENILAPVAGRATDARCVFG